MWIRIGLTVVLLLGGWSLSGPPAYASCIVDTASYNYPDGTPIHDDKCDATGAKKGANSITSLGTNTAAAPSNAEGSQGSFSFDLNGNARVTPGTLLFGEDSTNNQIHVGGGQVLTFTLMTGVTTNTTSATQLVYGGGKTFMASVSGTGAVSVTVDIYGDITSTATTNNWLCTIIVPSVSTFSSAKCFKQISEDFPYYHAVTSSISGTSATVEVVAVNGLAGGPQNEYRTSGNKIADALIKTGPGFLQCVIFSQHDAVPTAGTISINDATSAGTGTVIVEHVFTTATFMPTQICPQTGFTTGLYFDFTTTGDVSTVGSYR